MTGKRFTLKEYVTNYYAILDNGEEIAYADHKSAFTFCELLNYYEETCLKYEKTIRELKDGTYKEPLPITQRK